MKLHVKKDGHCVHADLDVDRYCWRFQTPDTLIGNITSVDAALLAAAQCALEGCKGDESPESSADGARSAFLCVLAATYIAEVRGGKLQNPLHLRICLEAMGRNPSVEEWMLHPLADLVYALHFGGSFALKAKRPMRGIDWFRLGAQLVMASQALEAHWFADAIQSNRLLISLRVEDRRQ